MDRKACRPLLPAHAARDVDSGSPVEVSSLHSNSRKTRRRQHVTKVACNGCRIRKAACDGHRPSCSACQQRKERCVYVSKDELETSTGALKRENEALKAKSKILEDLIHLMNSRPDLPAKIILQKLEASSALSSLQALDSEIEPPERDTVHRNLHDVPSDCGSESTVHHSTPYPSFNSSDHGGFGSPQCANQNDFLQSDAGGSLLESGTELTQSPFSSNTSNAAHPLEAQLFDPQLANLNISFWTMVVIPNRDAATIISQFLDRDLPIHDVLEPHLFVASLVNQRFDFCSSFLVNALLALASQVYTAQSPELAEQSRLFEREAIHHWQIENSFDSLTTVAGLILLAQAFSNRSQGQMGGQYLRLASEMAERLKQLGVQERIGPGDLGQLEVDEQEANMEAIWGTSNSPT